MPQEDGDGDEKEIHQPYEEKERGETRNKLKQGCKDVMSVDERRTPRIKANKQ